MVICPCVIMMPASNIPRRDKSRLPMPKTGTIGTRDATELKSVIRSNSSAIQWQPSQSTLSNKNNECIVDVKSSTYFNSLEKAPQNIKRKSDTLVLSNQNGKYVGTKPLKSSHFKAVVSNIPSSHQQDLQKKNPKHYSSSGQRLQLRRPENILHGSPKLTPVNINTPSEIVKTHLSTLSTNTSAVVPDLRHMTSKGVLKESKMSSRNFDRTSEGSPNEASSQKNRSSSLPRRQTSKNDSKRLSLCLGNTSQNVVESNYPSKKYNISVNQQPSVLYSEDNDVEENFKKESVSKFGYRNVYLPKLENKKIEATSINKVKIETKPQPNKFSKTQNSHLIKDVDAVTLKRKKNMNQDLSNSKSNMSEIKYSMPNKSEPFSSITEELEQLGQLKYYRDSSRTEPNSADIYAQELKDESVVEFSEGSGEELADTDQENDFEDATFREYEKLIETEEEPFISDSMMIASDVTLVPEETLSDDLESQEELEDTYSSKESICDDHFLLKSFKLLKKEVKNIDKKSEKFSSNFLDWKKSSEDDLNDFVDSDEDQEEVEDYIDVDCDVQPMASLRRPLVYGYGSSVASRHKNIPRYRFSWEEDSYDSDEVASTEEEIRAPVNFRETYWDYWLAKNKLKDLRNDKELCLVEPLSTTIGKRCCSNDKIQYDPELLLAQVSHPRSLMDATFSEYSSHIKSSIMKRYGLQYQVDDEIGINKAFGSTIDLSGEGLTSVDPGYFSESDAVKLKQSKYYDKDLSPCLTNEAVFSYLNGSKCNFSTHQNDQNFHNLDKEIFPKSYYLEQSFRHSMGENPWTHLLPYQAPQRDNAEIVEQNVWISSSPSITSLLSLADQTQPQKYRTSLLKISSKMDPKSQSKERNDKKMSKKSFLPTLFRRKKDLPSNVKKKVKDVGKVIRNHEESLSTKLRNENFQTTSIPLHVVRNSNKLQSPRELSLHRKSDCLHREETVCSSSNSNMYNLTPLHRNIEPNHRMESKSKRVSFKEASIVPSSVGRPLRDFGASNPHLRISETSSEKSTSSSSSSSSTKSSQSASSQDTVKTAIHRATKPRQ